MGARRPEAAEKCPDAGRVAPISACVSYQIDRLKSGFEAKERTIVPGHCALMGATRLASGHFSAALGRIVPVSACVLLQRIPGNLKIPQKTVLFLMSILNTLRNIAPAKNTDFVQFARRIE